MFKKIKKSELERMLETHSAYTNRGNIRNEFKLEYLDGWFKSDASGCLDKIKSSGSYPHCVEKTMHVTNQDGSIEQYTHIWSIVGGK